MSAVDTQGSAWVDATVDRVVAEGARAGYLSERQYLSLPVPTVREGEVQLVWAVGAVAMPWDADQRPHAPSLFVWVPFGSAEPSVLVWETARARGLEARPSWPPPSRAVSVATDARAVVSDGGGVGSVVITSPHRQRHVDAPVPPMERAYRGIVGAILSAGHLTAGAGRSGDATARAVAAAFLVHLRACAEPALHAFYERDGSLVRDWAMSTMAAMPTMASVAAE